MRGKQTDTQSNPGPNPGFAWLSSLEPAVIRKKAEDN